MAGALSRRLVAMATRYRLGATSGTSRYRVFTRSSGVDWEPTCARALGGRWAKLEDLLSRVSLAVSGPPFRLASPTPGRTCVNRHSAGGGSVQQRCGICSTCPGRIGRMLHSVSDDSLSSTYAIALEALESNARMPLDEHVEELPRRSESLGSHGSPLSRGSAAALGRLAGGSGRSVSSSRACRDSIDRATEYCGPGPSARCSPDRCFSRRRGSQSASPGHVPDPAETLSSRPMRSAVVASRELHSGRRSRR